MSLLLHITTDVAWARAQTAGQYVPDAFATEGFVHCSEAHQVIRVANLRFVGRTDLQLLWIESDRLASPVVHENLEGGEELFPHVYGPIDLEAVVAVTPFRPGADGRFDPSLLSRAAHP